MKSIGIKVRIVLAIALLLAFGGCKKGKTPTPVPKSNVDVYVAGYSIAGNSLSVATLWKNGIPTRLADTLTNTLASAVLINGNDVYVTGTVNDNAAYWKNGVLIELGQYPWGSSALGIAVNGSDVYITGSTSNLRGQAIAVYWKNNTAIRIAADTTLSTYGAAITLTGNNIYIVGNSEDDRSDMVYKAIFWKNGATTFLPQLSKYYSVANAIAINNADTLIVGHTTDTSNLKAYVGKAVFWKNGILNVLPGGISTSNANALAVYGNDTYITGSTDNDATYWKNGVAVTIANGKPIMPSYITSIAINNGNIYMAGASTGAAVYWINDNQVVLAQRGAANGVALVPH
jgi:uncharacterized membrane protein